MKKKPLIIIVSIVILISVYLVLAHFVPSICIHFKGEYIDAVPATCTETGFSSGYRCKLCGKIYTGHEVTPTIAHKFKKTIN